MDGKYHPQMAGLWYWLVLDFPLFFRTSAPLIRHWALGDPAIGAKATLRAVAEAWRVPRGSCDFKRRLLSWLGWWFMSVEWCCRFGGLIVFFNNIIFLFVFHPMWDGNVCGNIWGLKPTTCLFLGGMQDSGTQGAKPSWKEMAAPRAQDLLCCEFEAPGISQAIESPFFYIQHGSTLSFLRVQVWQLRCAIIVAVLALWLEAL